MPWSWLENSKTLNKQEGIHFVAANGGPMGNYGRRIVEFEPVYEEEASRGMLEFPESRRRRSSKTDE